MPGASRYFVGGVVAYDNQVKVDLLGVEPMLLAERGAVCAEVAEALALGVADRLGARAGLGVTGVAGPTGGTPEKPVGTVWYAASLDGTVRAEGSRFSGSRGDVRERAAQAALHLLLRVVEDHGR
jgi:nicotinamide-nucleotide amidase